LAKAKNKPRAQEKKKKKRSFSTSRPWGPNDGRNAALGVQIGQQAGTKYIG